MRKLVVCCLALAAWAAFIFCMSANDGDASTGLSDGVIVWLWPGYQGLSPADQLAFVESLSFPVRKLAHFSEYAVLGLLAFATFHQVGNVRRERQANAIRCAETAVYGSASSSGATAPASHASRSRVTQPAPRAPRALLRQAAFAVVLSFLYACLDEFHQLFVAGRCGQPFDVGVDTSGALVAVVVALLVIKRMRK